MSLYILPAEVIAHHASLSMRARHALWHQVREVWHRPDSDDEARNVRNIATAMNWALPAGKSPFSATGDLLLDNRAGEDFLFMHRRMIRHTNMLLSDAGAGPLQPWLTVPEPGDTDFPVLPAWDTGSPDFNRFLQWVKSDEYFERVMGVRQRFFQERGNLARLSLGALGNLLEMTIHNAMHMRWSSDPGIRRPSVLPDQYNSVDTSFVQPGYDWLGDTFSSHVNPHFWHLHGWIDSLIDEWAGVRGIDPSDLPEDEAWFGGPDPTDVSVVTPSPVSRGAAVSATSPAGQLRPEGALWDWLATEASATMPASGIPR